MPGVCLGGTLNPFLDISENLILEKRTRHEILYQKNRLFTKFNIQGLKFPPFSGNSIFFFFLRKSLLNREFGQFL